MVSFTSRLDNLEAMLTTNFNTRLAELEDVVSSIQQALAVGATQADRREPRNNNNNIGAVIFRNIYLTT